MPFSSLAFDPVRRARYSEGAGIYRIVPAAVARPTSLTELRAVIIDARDAGWSLTPRGAGSAMGGGNVGEGVVLDLTGFDAGRCEVSGRDRSARLSPAVTLARLQTIAAGEGLRFPPDPASGAWATLGGMISTNAAGARSVRDGSVRRWVRELTLESGEGPLRFVRGHPPDLGHPVMLRWYSLVAPLLARHAESIRGAFPKVRKNSAGYALDQLLTSGDLIDVVIGAEGTLGVVTDVVVDLAPIPEHTASLRVALRSRGDLVAALEAIRAVDPATLEFLDASFLRLVQHRVATPEFPGLMAQSAGFLLAEIEGDDAAAVAARVAAAAAAVAPFALDVQTALAPDAIAHLWAVRHGASAILAGLSDGRRSLQVIEDGCVPPARLAEYLDAIDAATGRQRIDAVVFGHAGDGHVHVNLLPNVLDADWMPRVRAVFDEVTAAILRLGGTTSGEHGAGRLRAGTLPAMYGETVMTVFNAIKQSFDPHGLWNPGVLLADGGDPFRHLKVGADATALPEGVAEQLRAIEIGAAWGESRWSEMPRPA